MTRLGDPAPPGLTTPRALRAAAALLVITSILVGVPATLLALAPALPVDVPDWSWQVLLAPDDGSLLLTLLLAIAWAAWGILAVSLVLEIGAALRRAPTPRLPGLGAVQRLAAALVAAVTVATGPIPAHATASAPQLVAGHVSFEPAATERHRLVRDLVATRAEEAALPGSGESPRAPAQAAPGDLSVITANAPHEHRHPTVKVQRHDTLWLLAEQYLGSGKRYQEIVQLNHGRKQPDGHTLTDDGRLRIGWTLDLPTDADLSAPRPRRLEVHRGDTMWDLAAEELGDARRYREIFELNAGDRQPDGSQLRAPDLIRPGWVLELPAGDDSPDLGVSAPAAPPPEHATTPGADSLPELERDAGGTNVTDEREYPADRSSAGDSPADRFPAVTDSDASRDPEQTPTRSDDRSELDPVVELQEVDGPGLGILLPAGGFLTGLLASGFVNRLARRRQSFVRHRGVGQYPGDPGASGRTVEQAAASGADPAPGGLLEQALTQLAGNASTARRTLPDVQVVTLTSTGVTLHLATTEAAAIAPFVRLGRRAWQLDAGQLTTDSPEYPCPYPALVTIGSTLEHLVLVNLESAGTLLVTGDAEQVPAVLRALRSELALGPAQAGTARTICLVETAGRDDASPGEQELATALEPGDLVIEANPDRASAALAHHLRSCALAVQKLGLRDTRGFVDEDPLAAPIPEIVLTDQPLGVYPGPWSGGAVITSEPTPEAGMTLTVTANGQATLQPGNHQLTAQTLSLPSHSGLVAALAATAHPTRRHGRVAADEGMIDLRGIRPRKAEPPLPRPPLADSRSANAPAPIGPRLLVLGELGIAAAAGNISEPSRITRLAEAAAFILLNPDCRPSQLQSALWPGQRTNPNTCRQLISRLRSLLGRDETGQPFLLPLAATGGRLRLADGVTSDWGQFQLLAEHGLADVDDTASLQLALGLVRGRPFGPVSGRELPWADLALTEMICLISDVAHELYCRLTASDDHLGARDAALRGLLTQTEADVLLDDAIAASRRLGDRPKVEQLQRRRAALDD